MIVAGANKYFRTPFNNEAEIETVVRDYAEYLFGSSIVFIPKSKITTMGGALNDFYNQVYSADREESGGKDLQPSPAPDRQ